LLAIVQAVFTTFWKASKSDFAAYKKVEEKMQNIPISIHELLWYFL
jgi:hypothetical protein